MKFPFLLPALPLLLSAPSFGGISYTTPGEAYFENFDSLPTDLAGNSNIEGTYPNGWMDDTITVVGDHVSVPGWYLYHPLVPASENGFNDHQRFRFGPGANTGSFWAFGVSAADPEKALGCVGSTTVAGNGANMYLALRLVNDTNTTLGGFTITFDGEQWRDGQSPTTGETMSFDYSLTATVADWFSATAVFTPVPSISFTSPVIADIGPGTQVNGNAEGLVPDLSATITGITWAPGAELWLRWADPQAPSNADDGLAVDNVSFTAFPPVSTPPGINFTFGRSESNRLQLQWQGTGDHTWQVEHTTDLQTWSLHGTPAPEANGPMTWVIPEPYLTTGRHYFRLLRTPVGP